MKLYKALKLKNKMVGEISKLQQTIGQKNSFIVGSEKNYDVKELLKELENKKVELVKLKLAINDANSKIQGDIYDLSETKSLIAFYGGLSCSKGKVSRGFGGEATEYDCQFSELERDKEVKKLEEILEETQERIDAHNHITEIYL